MKNALVLSGGGAKGAFQVGAITAFADRGITFDTISGVSVGCLNGSMVAQDKLEQMRKVWNEVKNESIYTTYSKFGIIRRNLLGEAMSLYGSDPLFNIIKENIKLEDFTKDFYMGVVDMYNGEYFSLTPNDFEDSNQLQRGVLASCLMPIVWNPVQVITKDNVLHQGVDGGVKNITPLSDVLGDLPDHIYIIRCQNGKPSIKKSTNIVAVALRTIDIMVSSIANDVKNLLRINSLVLQAKGNGYLLYHPDTGKEYKYFETTIISPAHDLGDSLDFSTNHIQECFNFGYNLAKT